jgi:integrase
VLIAWSVKTSGGTIVLTAKKVERTKTPGRHPCGLVKGLYLQITDGGAKSWVLRYQLRGREHMMGLGSAADFSLKEARDRARVARQQLADRIDPLVGKRAAEEAAKIAAARKLTFAEAAQRYFDQNEKRWRSLKHRELFLATLKSYVFPILGDMDVAAIATGDVLRALEPVWTNKAVTADRTRRRIEAVIDWAVIRGHRAPGTNPAKWKGHLDQVLPAPRKVAPIAHHAAMDFRGLPEFMVELRRHDGVAARAFEFLILTATRTGEVTGAVWGEIDLHNATWTIPAQRMKAGREHRVPLSPAAIDLLHKLPRERGNCLVFVGTGTDGGLSPIAMRRVMARLCQPRSAVTIHGFRSSFRDWAGEMTVFAHDICEAALAHARGDQSVRAYARGDLFAKRRKLMEAWADFCADWQGGADVIPLRR